MLAKFGIYEVLGVLVPGVFLLWVVGALLPASILREALPLSGNLADASVLVVVGYVTGLMLQGVSQHLVEPILKAAWGGLPSDRMLLPNDTTFPADHKTRLVGILKRRFDVAVDTTPASKDELPHRLIQNHAAFRVCYRAIGESDTILTFNAQYGLFRALFTMFSVLALVMAGLSVHEYFKAGMWRPHGELAAGLAVAGCISYLRTRKRAYDFARGVYDIFYAKFSQTSSGSGPP